MFKIIFETFFYIILIFIINKQAVAISGEEISAKVSDWLVKEGVNGTPVFSKNSFFKNCNDEIKIEKFFKKS